MAFQAKDGSKHTNRDTMKQANMRQSQAPAEPDGDEGGMQPEPHGVVDQHGPAVEVNVVHDHAGGQHGVKSRHQDGHEHISQHGSAAEAHDAGKCLGGACDCGGMG